MVCAALLGLFLLPGLTVSHEARPWENGYFQALRARMQGRRGRCGDDFLRDYEQALQDSKWRKKVRSRRSCSKLVKVVYAAANDIEKELAEELTHMDEEPSQDKEECEQVAAEAMLGQLQKRARKPGRTLKRLMRVVTERAATSFCRGSFGLRRWLKRRSGLRARNPASYERQLRCKVQGKMGLYLHHFAAAFCKKGAGGNGNWQRFRWGQGCQPTDSNDAGRDGRQEDDADDDDDEAADEQDRQEDESGEREEFDSGVAEVTLQGIGLVLLFLCVGTAIFLCGAVGLCKGATGCCKGAAECCKNLSERLRRKVGKRGAREHEREREPLTPEGTA